MDLSNLKPAEGSIKTRKRIGRGQGSTRGGTATRGHKGQKSRSGYSRKAGFEGGQMPIYRRVPKYGFKNRFRVGYQGIKIGTIQELADNGITIITPKVLLERGLTHKNDLVKILGRGELKAKVEITAHAFTATAIKAIEAVGGVATKL